MSAAWAAPQPEEKRAAEVAGQQQPAGGRAPETYLNDSLEAADVAAKATELADHRRWHEAAELLQQALRDHRGKVIQVEPGRYVGVAARINRMVASWPKEGLAAYNAVAEPQLRGSMLAIEGSRDVHDYLPLLSEFFCADLALSVAETIVELAVEAGDFALAQEVLAEVLQFHPARGRAAQRFGALLAVVQGIAGGKTRSEIPGEARIRWKGQDQHLAVVLAEIRRDFAELRTAPDEFEWPTFGGSPDRNRTLAADVTEPGLLWRFQLAPPQTRSETDGSGAADRETARRLSVFPIAGSDFLFAQFDRQLIALHRNTGAVAWRFQSKATIDAASLLDDLPPGWNSPTLSGNRLFATIRGEQSSYYDPDADRDGPELVCLDERSGTLLWSVDADAFGIKPSEFVLDSSPIVSADDLYVVARRRRSFGFEDCYLYSLRATDGGVQFRVHLGGASTATFGSRTVAVSIAALHEGTIYVGSGLGSIAAVSAYTGEVRWMGTYERFRETDAGAPGVAARDLMPWQFNPIVYADGRLIALPTDSTSVLIFSSDGDLESVVPREAIGGMQTLLGVRQGQVCGVGDAVLCFDLADPSRQWAADLPGEVELFGRAAMTDDAIWLPLRRALLRYQPGLERHSEFAWPREVDGGNVLITPDSLIVAEPMAVAAYGERERIWGALRERIAAAPSDPLPPLEFAEVAFGAGQTEEAIEALRLADKRLSAGASSDWERIRRRLFSDALSFAQVVDGTAEQQKMVEVFFDIAAGQTWDRESNVRYRLHFSKIFEGMGQPERAASLYQQILRDRGLRCHASGPGEETAGQTAELGLAALIEGYGPSVYDDIESEAKAALAAASESKDNEGLAEVVRTFPNSQASTRALAMMGDRHAGAGELKGAACAYTQAFHREGSAMDRATLVAKLAEVQNQAGRPRDAYLWLSKGVLEFPGIHVNKKGRKLTFAELRDNLLAEWPGLIPRRASLHVPLREPVRQSMDPGAKLLTALFPNAPIHRPTNYFVATPRTMMAYTAQSSRPAWPAPAAVPAASELLVQLEHLAIFATKYRVFALDLAAGSTVWSMGSEPAHVADPGGDWEQGGSIRGHALQDQLLVTARDDGLFTAMDIRSGKVLWSETLPAPAGKMSIAMPWLVYETADETGGRVRIVDAETGQAAGDISRDTRQPIEQLLATFDGLIVVAGSKTVECYESESIRRKWSASFSGQLRAESLRLTPDGVVYCDGERELVKLAMDDGRALWRSAPLEDDIDSLRVEPADDLLLVLAEKSVAALDMASGVTLWTGAVPDDARFVRHLITQDLVASIHLPRSESEQPMVYFYQMKTGRIPSPGGTAILAGVEAVESASVLDGTLLIQSPESLLVLTSGD